MKTKNIAKLLSYVAVMFLFMSCNKDAKFHVTEEVENTFSSMYPDATALEWDMIDSYLVAEFRNEGFYCKAWYSADGRWQMTETSDLVYDRNLPDHIKADFESKYNRKNIDDITRVEFASVKTRYIIELDMDGADVYLFYLASGEVFKQVSGKWNNRPIIIPQEILSYVTTHHPQADIFDADVKSLPIRIKIKENNKKVLCFTSAAQWLATYWDININEVSNLVQGKLNEVLDANDKIDVIHQMQYIDAEGIIYVFEVNNGTKTLFIKENGVQIEMDGSFL